MKKTVKKIVKKSSKKKKAGAHLAKYAFPRKYPKALATKMKKYRDERIKEGFRKARATTGYKRLKNTEAKKRHVAKFMKTFRAALKKEMDSKFGAAKAKAAKAA